MNFDVHAAVGGRFKLQAFKSDTGELTKDTGWFDNLVLDNGLDMMAAADWFYGVQLGLGNSDPTAGQTQLDSFFVETTTTQTNVVGVSSEAPYYAWRRKTFRFNAGVFNNTILAEIGIYGNKSAPKLWNRALIRDQNGNPTTITMLNDEYLDITVEVRSYIDINDKTGSFEVRDKTGAVTDTINYTIRPAGISSANTFNIGTKLGQATSTNNNLIAYTGDIGIVTAANPLGSRVSSQSDVGLTWYQYVAGSKRIMFRTTYSLTQGNGSLMKSFFIKTALGNFQVQLEDGKTLSKTAEQTMQIFWTLNWDRYAT